MPLAPLARRSLLALALAAAAAALAAQPAAARSRSVPPAAMVRAHHVAQAHAARHRRLRRPRVLRVRYAHPKRVLRAKRAALRRFRRALRRHHRGRRTSPPIRFKGTVFGGLNASGFAFDSGNDPAYTSPSDSTGAIGASNYLEFTNGQIVVYDRALAPVAGAAATIDDFVNPPSGTSSGDPQIQWDPVSQRWYYAAYASNSDSTANFLMWGWSKTSSPTSLDSSGWCKFALDTGGVFPDFPKLGHDDTHLIFGVNGFDGIEQVSSLIFVFAKPLNGDLACPAAPTGTQFGSANSPLTTSSGAPADTPVPANSSDSQASGYVVAADLPDALMLWHVAGGPSGPQLLADGDLAVKSYTLPGNAPQPGTANVLDTLDSRLTQAVAHADPGAGGTTGVWTQHTVDGAGGRSAVRWYEITPANLAVRQRGAIADASSFLFNAAISPAGDGQSAAIVYNASGPALRPAVRASVRRGAAPTGTVGSPLTLVGSASSFNDFACEPPTDLDPPICRWGDYAAATPDPSNGNVVWGTAQYSGGARWLTRNFAVQIDQVGPTAAISAAPNPVVAGQNVTFDGSASADTLATIVGYDWDLDGNGTLETSTGASPTVTRPYAAAGSVPVRLRVTDANGDQSDAGLILTVNPKPKPPGPTPECLAARKKHKDLAHSVENLKRHVRNAKTERSRRHYAKLLTTRRAQLKRAQEAERKACAA